MFIVLLLLRNSPGLSPFRSFASGIPYLTVCFVSLFVRSLSIVSKFFYFTSFRFSRYFGISGFIPFRSLASGVPYLTVCFVSLFVRSLFLVSNFFYFTSFRFSRYFGISGFIPFCSVCFRSSVSQFCAPLCSIREKGSFYSSLKLASED